MKKTDNRSVAILFNAIPAATGIRSDQASRFQGKAGLTTGEFILSIQATKPAMDEKAEFA